FVVAFLLATPELGVETFALSVRFLGWPLAMARLAAALLVAFVAALLVARTSTRDAAPTADPSPMPDAPTLPFATRFREQLDALAGHVLPWTLVGLVAAAYVDTALPEEGFALHGLRGYAATSLIAIPAYVCAASATPLAAVLVAKGLAPGAALVGLLLGPATNLATLGWLRAAYGGRAVVATLAGLVLVTWGAGAVIDGIGLMPPAPPVAETHAHGVLGWLLVGAVGLLALKGIAAAGLRGWLGSLGEGLGGVPATS
ncbi:MAG: permease, partial [Myxococcota bacterium]